MVLLNAEECQWILDAVKVSISSIKNQKERERTSLDAMAVTFKMGFSLDAIQKKNTKVTPEAYLPVPFTLFEVAIIWPLLEQNRGQTLHKRFTQEVKELQISDKTTNRQLKVNYAEGVCLLGGLQLVQEGAARSREWAIAQTIQELSDSIALAIQSPNKYGDSQLEINQSVFFLLTIGLQELRADQIKNQRGFFKKRDNLMVIEGTIDKLRQVGFVMPDHFLNRV